MSWFQKNLSFDPEMDVTQINQPHEKLRKRLDWKRKTSERTSFENHETKKKPPRWI